MHKLKSLASHSVVASWCMFQSDVSLTWKKHYCTGWQRKFEQLKILLVRN